MVIRTELCSYCEWRIYPGCGQRYYAKDGKASIFITKKAKMLALRKVKVQKIRWSVAWRRANKKIKTGDLKKKYKKKAARVQRAIVGVSLDELQKKRQEKPEVRAARAEEALREIKLRKEKNLNARRETQKAGQKDKGAKKAQEKQQQKVKAPKGGKKK